MLLVHFIPRVLLLCISDVVHVQLLFGLVYHYKVATYVTNQLQSIHEFFMTNLY